MEKTVVFAAACAVICGMAAGGVDVSALDETGMFPFVPSYDSPANAVDMSHLLSAPAGRDGRVRVKGGHFVNDRGRVRLNATNLTGPSNFPTHEEAERLAARLARFGVNCVRLHYFDSDYGSFMLPVERGIIADDFRTRRRIDAGQRDRQDYLVAEFKKRGIYIDMNLHVARTLDARDGFAGGNPWANKGVDQFDPRIIELEKEYARDILCHVNPYTGMDYLKDPVVAVVELNNEDAIWHQYLTGALDGLSETYLAVFRNLWNDWLVKRYGTAEKLQEAWKGAQGGAGFPAVAGLDPNKGELPIVRSKDEPPPPMRRDFYQFLCDTERRYWTGMHAFLRDELGLEAPVSATQLSYSPPHLQAELDFVDIHGYWCHPSIGEKWKIENRAMVNTFDGCISDIASQRVAGKPYTVSEYNHPYPIFYGAEGQPMLRAYGAFQGWDGLFEYSYNNRQNAEPEFNEYFFSIAARTDVLAHFPACAAIYLRGDVRESAKTVVGGLPYAEYFDRLVKERRISQRISDAKPSQPNKAALVHGVAVDVTPAAKGGAAAPAGCASKHDGRVLVSDTDELRWDLSEAGAGIWTVDTANTKLFSGFPRGRTVDLGGVKLAVGETKLGWATVSLVSHDATGFGEGGKAARILLTATALCHNGGAKFTSHGGDVISCRGEDWGRGKTVCEGVPATVTLPAPAAKTVCRALDERGEPKADVPVKADADGRAVVEIGPAYRTVWYEVVVR